jgi:hypothetical protein
MGRKSQLKNLGAEVKIRIQLAKEKVADTWRQGQLTAAGIRLYKQLKPLEKHIDVDKCEYCTPLFLEIKNCPGILALPEGSFKEANAHILEHKPCRENLEKILNCPDFVRKHGKVKHNAK